MLQYPVLRLGFVMASGRAIQNRTAEKIAVAILGNADEFRQAIIDCIERDSGARVAARQPDSKEGDWMPRSRRTPAIIIDFPSVDAVLDGRNVQIRSCLTICVNHKQSKCWTRINARDPSVGEAEADALFDSFERLARLVNDDISQLYTKYIYKALGRRIPLSKFYEINVRTASKNDNWVEEYFQSVFSSREIEKDISKLKVKMNKVLLKMNSELTKIPAPAEVIELRNKKTRQIGMSGLRERIYSDAELLPHRVHAVYVLEYGSSSANFTGVGYDPYSDKVSFQDSLSHIASGNLAVEYGSLF